MIRILYILIQKVKLNLLGVIHYKLSYAITI